MPDIEDFRALLGRALTGTQGRETYSALEIQDILLDLWNLLPEPTPDPDLELVG